MFMPLQNDTYDNCSKLGRKYEFLCLTRCFNNRAHHNYGNTISKQLWTCLLGGFNEFLGKKNAYTVQLIFQEKILSKSLS